MNSQDVNVRHAAPPDSSDILHLWDSLHRQHRHALPEIIGEAAGPDPTMVLMLDSLAQRGQAIFVAEVDGGVRGMAHVMIRTAPEHPLLVPRTYAVLTDVAVDPAVRHHGVGEALVEAAEDWAREHDVHQFEAEVYSFNEEALRFFEEIGYEVVSRIVFKHD
jgi:shikimate dehydrogenase